ncbi:MAG TPA: DUF6519 domain-containing protein [Chryseolinea sp.]|nr:DUF6519 domain-containing protein [Chryseolinea sp.]
MATFDISRVAFDPRKHYSSVRMQQGRVLTDDDYNEGRRIEDEVQRRTQTDVIGGYGSPDKGFKIVDLVNNIPNYDFGIHNGSIYLGGIRWEMEKTKTARNVAETFETFLNQRDWLTLDPAKYPTPTPNDLPAGIRYDLVYLHAWQQAICAVEDSSLFEVALNAFDTTTRLRNMRRVDVFTDTGSPECAISWKKLRTKWEDDHLGHVNKQYERIRNIKMSVGFTGAQAAEDLCSPSIAGGYLGAENQAIRVQITAPDKFTWGYDNASPLYRVKIDPLSKKIVMKTLPKDQYHWPMTGQVVEILACDAVLPNDERLAAQSGFINRVAGSYNPDTQSFTIEDPLPAGFGNGWLPAVDYFFLRVWNRGTDLTSPEEIPFVEDTPVTLGNTGLQITFSKWTTDRAMEPVAEDHWVIAARPETPDVIVPWELKKGARPMGVRRYFAPLAIIEWTLTGGSVQGSIIHDCRRPFRPLTEQECCCTFTVGDGVNSKGDFQSIQEAIDSLPAEGGKICVLAGIHETNAVVRGRRKIHITGCGEQTIVRAAEGNNQPIFLIENSQKIKLDCMTMFTLNGMAVLVRDISTTKLGVSEGITIRDNRILAFIHAIRVDLQPLVSGDNSIKILFNQIGMFDKDGGDVAIFSLADGVLIEQNRIVKIAAPKREEDPDNPGPDSPPDPFEPCEALKKTYEKNEKFRHIIFLSLGYVAHYVPGGLITEIHTLGGIQIGGGSERVTILRNEIFGGKGNGITLGHVHRPTHDLDAFSVFLYDITIQSNEIREMGLSGVGTVVHPEPSNKDAPIHIENLLIVENDIKYCVREILDPKEIQILSAELPVSGISLAMCEDCIIRENWLEENGKLQPQPVCGIFILIAEKVDIINNRIINNGPELSNERNQQAGPRGGIVILFAFRLPQPAKTGLSTGTSAVAGLITAQDTVPAARIHDNIVSQPLGHALLLIALGPVSAVSNQFNSQGIYKGSSLSKLAGSVLILNVGLSKDLINIIVPSRNWGYVSPAAVLALIGTSSQQSPALALLLQLFPSGKVMYSTNQTTLDMRSFDRDIALSSQLIFSLDDVAFVNNQSECAGLVAALPQTPATYDLVLLNTFLLAPTVRCNDNRFTDGFTLTLLSLMSFSYLNTVVSNQSTHCIVVPFWIFRRKFLNTELNNIACRALGIEFQLSKHNANSMDEQYNFPKF